MKPHLNAVVRAVKIFHVSQNSLSTENKGMIHTIVVSVSILVQLDPLGGSEDSEVTMHDTSGIRKFCKIGIAIMQPALERSDR